MQPHHPSPRRTKHHGAVLFILIHALACADGQLQAATVTAPGDEDTDVIDAPIAVGGRVPIAASAQLLGSTAVGLRAESTDARIGNIDEDGYFVATRGGTTAVLFVAEDDSVIDLVHLATVVPNRLALHRRSEDGDVDDRALPDTLQLFVDEELHLVMRVYQQAQQLAGEATADFSIDDNTVASLANPGFAHERRLRAERPGVTTLRVNAFGLTHSLTVEVLP